MEKYHEEKIEELKKPCYKKMLKCFEHELAIWQERYENTREFKAFNVIHELLESIRYIKIILEKKERYAKMKQLKNTHTEYEKVDKPHFTKEMAIKWVSKMENEDGTKGQQWSIEQTNAVAVKHGIKFEHITEYCFWATMNMIHSDYCAVAKKYNLDVVEFYVDMSKAFLFDEDSVVPSEKLYYYYENIVKK